jgi:hypothetical protein
MAKPAPLTTLLIAWTLLATASGARLRRVDLFHDHAEEAHLTSLSGVRHNAISHLQKLQHEMTLPTFGDGLNRDNVRDITEGVGQFWAHIRDDIHPDDKVDMSDEADKSAMRIIGEVAQLQHDLHTPARRDQVVPEFVHIRGELDDVIG